MVIHAFGGYYGLAISWMLYRPNLHQSKRLHGSVYHSDVFAMIGAYLAHPLFVMLTFHAFLFFFAHQGLCSSGCSGPVSTPPLPTTETDSTELPSTRTWVWPPASSPPWPSPACTRSEGGWTWWLSDKGPPHHCLGFLITNMLLFLAGAHPKRHAGRRCCHGNISRVHDHPLWCSDRGFLLRHHLHLWLHLRNGELVCLVDKLKLFF